MHNIVAGLDVTMKSRVLSHLIFIVVRRVHWQSLAFRLSYGGVKVRVLFVYQQ
jgi:hypothetical protein